MSQFGSVVATLVLARLLDPADFGIVALAQSLVGLATLLSLSGIAAALVPQRSDLIEAASTYFWLLALIGLAATSLFALAARPLCIALGQPTATPYVVVLAVTFPIALLTLVPSAMLQREFRFGSLNGGIVAGAVTYFATEIVLAAIGYGAWAVVFGQIAGATVTLIVTVAAAGWRPRAISRFSIVRSDMGVTSGLSGAHLLTFLQKNADFWVVSRFLGGPILGAYYIAYVLPNILRQRASLVLRQVMLPVYAAQGSVEEIATVWRRSFPSTFGIALPALTGVAVTADALVDICFGDQWQASVMPMRILAVGTIADLIVTSVSTAAIVQKLIRPYLVVLAVRAITVALFSLAGVVLWKSATAVAWAILISAAVTLVVQEFVLSCRLMIGIRTVYRQLLGYCFLAALMAAVVWVVSAAMPNDVPNWIRFGCCVILGAATYLGGGWIFARRLIRPVLADALGVIRGG
jgi:PST family polysaccharide transporter